MNKLLPLLGLALLFITNSSNSGILYNEYGLYGVTDININGQVYDWEYTETTCQFFYNGCDDSSDFPFPSYEEAMAAHAAMKEVLVANQWWNYQPSYCYVCNFGTPYSSFPDPGDGYYYPDPTRVADILLMRLDFDAKEITFEYHSYYMTYQPTKEEMAYSVWKLQPTGSVPTPAPFALLLLGLVAMLVRRYK